MREKHSISVIKAMAKDRLLGNYKVAALSFAILYVMALAILLILLPTILSFVYAGNIIGATSLAEISFSGLDYVIYYVILAIIGAIVSTLAVGTNVIALKLARGEEAYVSDLYFSYKNHPDKVIILFLINYLIRIICSLPNMIFTYTAEILALSDGVYFFVSLVLEIAGMIISFLVMLFLAQTFFLYANNPSNDIRSYLIDSIRLMKGNKGRLFYYYLTMIGWGLLVVMTLGIGIIWIAPYQTVALALFFMDISGEDIENMSRPEREEKPANNLDYFR